MHISLAAEKIGTLWGWPLTNTVVTFWIAIAFILIAVLIMRLTLKLVPGGLQNIFELLIEGLLGITTMVFGTEKEARRYFPFLATFFIAILVTNWMGLLPGYGSIGFREIKDGKEVFVPLLRSTSADLNTTLAYALISVGSVQYFGIRSMGTGTYFGKFFNFKGPINFIVGLLEFISEFTKVISFSFRLFGNVFAGEVLLMVIAFLVPVVATVPFLGLELFVGAIQALVFFMLTAVFIKLAITAH